MQNDLFKSQTEEELSLLEIEVKGAEHVTVEETGTGEY